MLFNRPKLLFYLKSKSLELYYLDSDQIINIKLSPDIIRHLEIVNEDKFIQTVSQIIKHTGLEKEKAIIVLSDNIVFDKLVPGDESEETEKIISRFYENIPLKEDLIAKKTVPIAGKLVLLATNRQLYKIIKDIAGEFNWEIKAVIPMVLFAKLDENIQLNPKQIQEILNSEDIFKEANFLEEDLTHTIPVVLEQKKSSKMTILLIIVFILSLIGLIVYILISQKIIHLPPRLSFFNSKPNPVASIPLKVVNQTVITATEASNSAAKTREATSSPQQKDEVNIHVLNGSGIAGEASIIKDKLIEKGFTNVITGNVERSEATQSSIIYSNKVDKSIKDEVSSIMESLVPQIAKSEDNLTEFDILIILGKLSNIVPEATP